MTATEIHDLFNKLQKTLYAEAEERNHYRVAMMIIAIKVDELHHNFTDIIERYS